MSSRSARWGLLLATVLSASFASAAGGDSTVRVNPARVPTGTDARTRAALNKSLQHYLSEATLAESLRAYSISPSLVQFRRYVEDTPAQAKLVCLVDLVLSDAQGSIVASVRGSATTRGAGPRETIDAAAHAAVSRLPSALQALDAARKGPSQVATR